MSDQILLLPRPTLVKDELERLYSLESRKFVLFKQGLKRTNMQYAELFSLLKLHTKCSHRKNAMKIGLISQQEAEEFIKEHLVRITGASNEALGVLDRRLEEYFSNKLVIVPYMTSVEIWVPCSLDVDLESVCAESGYVHSCGYLVFGENLQGIHSSVVEKNLVRVIRKFSSGDTKLLIAPYCHEDFTLADRKKSLFLSDGLDDVKIHIGKAYLGQEPLYRFLDRIQQTYSAYIRIAPRDYRQSRKHFESHFPGMKMSTVWIIADFKVSYPSLSASSERFLISYRQTHRNQNLYHSYEENKPAWASHTTLPHSLAGAMINLARPWLDKVRATMCDPFSGSGTIFLEAQKFKELECLAFDKSPLAGHMLRDNIAFFNLSAAELKDIATELENYRSQRSFVGPKRGKQGSSGVTFNDIVAVVDAWSATSADDFLELSEEEVDRELGKLARLTDRIALYCALRATVRGRVSLDRDESSWQDIFDKEINDLVNQMHNHREDMPPPDSNSSDEVAIIDGGYSMATVPPPPFEARHDLFGAGSFDVRDVQMLPVGAFDAIVCDPPYGFNTDTDRQSAALFAQLLIKSLVEGLKAEGGQIIMAAPRISNSGREIPLDLRSDILARSLIDYCERTNRTCWKPAHIMPCPLSDYVNPPYYWKSDKALSRKILHFWIRPNVT